MAIDCPPAEIRVVDGDTVACAGVHWRLVGLDAPELHGACPAERALAQAAAAALRGEAERCGLVLVPIHGRERWGRRLGRALACGRPVAEWLISLGLARPYDGGARRPWCTPVPRRRP